MLFLSFLLPGCGSETEETTGNEISRPPHEENNGVKKPDVSEPIIEHNDLFSVVIDNSVQARPQTGLNQAQRIYELPAEGGITRFLAFFRYDAVEKIGPVRSARIDFLDIILPYDSSFAHCGASNDALLRIQRELDKDICEIHNSPFAFFRDNARRAPNNLYTSTDLLNKAYDRRGFSRESKFNFVHTLKDNFTNLNHTTIHLDYSSSSASKYRISYQYNSSTKKYTRLINNQPHRLTDADSLQVNGVIFIETRFETHANGLVTFQTTGENRAWIAYKGQHLKTTWKRDSVNSHFKFLIDGSYIEIKNPGFMIHIIPPNSNVVFE